jgi:4-amino-4-deoxy-L-arabinose transferase-like glycosyltransferase
MPLAIVLVALASILFLIEAFRSSKVSLQSAFSLMLAGMLVIPQAWSALTVMDDTDGMLPAAYGVRGGGNARPVGNVLPVNNGTAQGDDIRDDLLEFLQANTQEIEYLVAVPSSGIGARYVLATGRPVLYMGGFSGNDNVVRVEDLTDMVARGELRYVLFGGQGNKLEITNWLQTSCSVVKGPQQQNINQEREILYDCQ